jgi:hypothetical protein
LTTTDTLCFRDSPALFGDRKHRPRRSPARGCTCAHSKPAARKRAAAAAIHVARAARAAHVFSPSEAFEGRTHGAAGVSDLTVERLLRVRRASATGAAHSEALERCSTVRSAPPAQASLRCTPEARQAPTLLGHSSYGCASHIHRPNAAYQPAFPSSEPTSSAPTLEVALRHVRGIS